MRVNYFSVLRGGNLRRTSAYVYNATVAAFKRAGYAQKRFFVARQNAYVYARLFFYQFAKIFAVGGVPYRRRGKRFKGAFAKLQGGVFQIDYAI